MILNEQFSRRDFLRRLTVIGTAALLPLAAGVSAAPAGFVPAGRVADFKPGDCKAVTLPGGAAVLLRRLPGRTPRFQALSARCTHKGCLVAWAARDKQFHCPCHGGRFDAEGKNIGGPPPAPLPVFATRVVGGAVLVGTVPFAAGRAGVNSA